MTFNRFSRSILIHSATAALFLFLAVVNASGALSQEASGTPALRATVEVLQPFAYEGDEMLVRVTIANMGEEPFENVAGIELASGLKVLAGPEFNPLKNEAKPDGAKNKPEVLPSGGFFGGIQNIVEAIPEMKKAGRYRISWEGAGVSSNTLAVTILPKFDTEEEYVAVFETDFGFLEFDLLTDLAPRHVQNFYDLAGQGFYDNTMLHQVIKGVEIRGGDPTGTGRGLPIYLLDPEINAEAKHVRGTLSMLRLESRFKDNGSQFVITLAPLSNYDGVLTAFGRLRSGEETLSAIENIPTSGQYEPPYFKPLKPVFVKSVSVQKAQDRKASGG